LMNADIVGVSSEKGSMSAAERPTTSPAEYPTSRSAACVHARWCWSSSWCPHGLGVREADAWTAAAAATGATAGWAAGAAGVPAAMPEGDAGGRRRCGVRARRCDRCEAEGK
jgi:hypothetical protein